MNLRAAMRDWFSFLYKHDLTDDEIDAILSAPRERGSPPATIVISQDDAGSRFTRSRRSRRRSASGAWLPSRSTSGLASG